MGVIQPLAEHSGDLGPTWLSPGSLEHPTRPTSSWWTTPAPSRWCGSTAPAPGRGRSRSELAARGIDPRTSRVSGSCSRHLEGSDHRTRPWPRSLVIDGSIPSKWSLRALMSRSNSLSVRTELRRRSWNSPSPSVRRSRRRQNLQPSPLAGRARTMDFMDATAALERHDGEGSQITVRTRRHFTKAPSWNSSSLPDGQQLNEDADLVDVRL
jgi:hypothetical protein